MSIVSICIQPHCRRASLHHALFRNSKVVPSGTILSLRLESTTWLESFCHRNHSLFLACKLIERTAAGRGAHTLPADVPWLTSLQLLCGASLFAKTRVRGDGDDVLVLFGRALLSFWLICKTWSNRLDY